VFVSGYDLGYRELGREIARWSRHFPPDVLLVVDPGPLVADIPADTRDTALSRVSILTLNRREAALLAGTHDLVGIADAVLPRLAADAILIVRGGPAGCVLYGAGLPETPMHVAAPSVQAIDSTGAGDTHTGVFIASIAHGLDPVAAATRANAAAAFSVTRRGPATAPTTAELAAFLATWPQSHTGPPGENASI
jgi:sugar/nucleoside kinase (ribokinase family)